MGEEGLILFLVPVFIFIFGLVSGYKNTVTFKK
jgi:hypothetical protein